MDYFYCNACHYCFTDSQMPDRLSIPGGFTPLFRRLETIVPI